MLYAACSRNPVNIISYYVILYKHQSEANLYFISIAGHTNTHTGVRLIYSQYQVAPGTLRFPDKESTSPEHWQGKQPSKLINFLTSDKLIKQQR